MRLENRYRHNGFQTRHGSSKTLAPAAMVPMAGKVSHSREFLSRFPSLSVYRSKIFPKRQTAMCEKCLKFFKK